MTKYYNSCSQLPSFELKQQEIILGNTTNDAMNGGMFWGYIGMIEKCVEKIIDDNDALNVSICITGGSALLIKDYLRFYFEFDENLTANGLNEIWKINN
jgi:type III pantothenate kinase